MPPEVGRKLPPLSIASVAPETMTVWAPLLRDPNPIHLDRAAVRAAGLGERLINQGPINMAWAINMLTAAFPGGRIASISHRFADNVYEGDAVTVEGVVTGVEEDAGDCRVACDFVLATRERGPAVTGKAIVVVSKAADR